MNNREITREEFYRLARECVVDAREKVEIVNQLEGYKKWRKAMKDEYIAEELRNVPHIITGKDFCLYTAYKAITFAGIGHCSEMAKVLLYLLLEKLHKLTDFKISIVTASGDHRFLRLKIKLQNEIESEWELDAWDPRIIDVSERPDGCDIYLMATKHNVFKKSNQNQLYLYKDNESKKIFYLTKHKERHYLNDSISQKLMKESFNQSTKHPNKFDILELCNEILAITSKRNHTSNKNPVKNIDNVKYFSLF